MNDEFHYYSLALCIFQYFLPVLLMTYSYLMVATTIWKQKGTIESQHSHNSKNTRETNMLHGRKKVSHVLQKMLFRAHCLKVIYYINPKEGAGGLMCPQLRRSLAISRRIMLEF